MEGLGGLVSPPWVHGDADGASHFLMDTSHPEFLQAEAPASSDLGVVAHRGAPHDGPDGSGRGARGDAARFRLPGLASADLACRLVEPSVHSPLPVLVEVGLQDHAIPAGRHGCLPCRGTAERKGQAYLHKPSRGFSTRASVWKGQRSLSFGSLLAPPFPFSTVRQGLKLEILPQPPSPLLLTEKQP